MTTHEPNKPNNEPGLGEQALSKVAELGLTSQLDEVEELSVDIRTDTGKVIQGEVDSVTIKGKGLVMQKDLRMETLEINTEAVSIDPLSIVFGSIELTEPTNATARILLKEDDLNRALSSEFLQKRLNLLKLRYEEKPFTVNVDQVQLNLPGDGKLCLYAKFLVLETAEFKQLFVTCLPRLNQAEQQIQLEILSAEGQGLTPELVTAIINQVTTLLDLKNFEIPGMSLYLREFEVQPGQLILCANTRIEQIPSESD